MPVSIGTQTLNVKTTFEWDPDNQYVLDSELTLHIDGSTFSGVNQTLVDQTIEELEKIDPYAEELYEDLLEEFDGNATEAEEALIKEIENLPVSNTIPE